MAHQIAPDAQEAIATARFIRMSPSKARRVVDLIRGRHVDDARRVLRFTQRGAADEIAKVLESAIANAENNRGLPGDELTVARAWVDEGPTLKRYRPRALGRATRVRKRTCHISIVVGRDEDLLQSLLTEPEPVAKPKRKKTTTDGEASTTAKKTPAKPKAAGPKAEAPAAEESTEAPAAEESTEAPAAEESSEAPAADTEADATTSDESQDEKGAE